MTIGSDVLAQIARESALESGVERFPEDRVATELRRLYGLTGRLSRMPTEKDDTFRLVTSGGRFLVKIAPAAEDSRIVNLQSAVMLHLEKSAVTIPAQRLIRGIHDQMESSVIDPGGEKRIMRVLSYLDGDLLAASAPTPAQLGRVGAMLARIDTALSDCRHPYESRLLIWDLKNFPHMRPLLDFVTDRDDEAMAAWVFDQFDEHVAPRIADLETQMIHGDFSPFNVVVDPAVDDFVTGVIDFGDVVRSPILFELSVAVANQIGVDRHRPWAGSLDLVRGYRSVRPLPDDVAKLLAITGPARLLLRALIFGWRATVDPQSRDYGLSHSALDWTRLRCALSMPKRAVEDMLAAAGVTASLTGKDTQ
ncbi:phosphotransferase [Mycobacterium sp. NPDC003449]